MDNRGLGLIEVVLLLIIAIGIAIIAKPLI